MKRSWSRPARYYTLTLILITLVWIIWQIREMIQPLVIAALLAYLMNPGVAFLKKHLRARHLLAVSLVYFFSLGLLIALPAIFIPILIDDWQTLSQDLLDMLNQIQGNLYRPVTIGNYIIHFEQFLPQWDESLALFISRLPEMSGEILESTSRNAAWFLVILVTIFYLLLDWERLRRWMVHLAPEPYQADIEHIFADIKWIWAAYLRGQLALMLIVGVVFTVVWLAIGLPGAVVIGVLTGLFSLIPDVGPLAATALALIVALLEGSNYLPLSNFWFAALVVGIYTVLINFKNIWLRPRVMGRSVHMHEGLVFVLIVAAVIFQGILGALIVVPVVASAAIVGRYLRARIFGLEPFPELTGNAVLMASQPEAGAGEESDPSQPQPEQIEPDQVE